MPRFFVDSLLADSAVLTGENAHHIGYSLRMRVGEALTVCANGIDYDCEIAHMTADTVELRVLASAPCKAEPTAQVTLYQAMPKLDKLEQIIQKAVELGAVRVVPVLTQRCVSRPTAEAFSKKLPRLKKIALEAAKQSGRGRVPEIAPMCSFSQALRDMQAADAALMLYESGGVRMSTLPLTDTARVALLVGSEGGFDPAEAEAAKATGVTPVWLGERILRCETAPLAALSVLMYLTNNL